MYKNKNKYLVHITGIFLLLTCQIGMAMQTPGTVPAPTKKSITVDEVDGMQEDALKGALKENIIDLNNLNKKHNELDEKLKETTASWGDAIQELKFVKANPSAVVSKAEFVNCPESVAKAMADKLQAEKLLIEYQKGGWAKASHVADQVAWPIVKEQGAVAVGELRKKLYKTKIEKQNEEIGKLNKKNAKKQFKINQEDLAAKRAAVASNKRNQEGLELLQDVQTLGQILLNMDTTNKTANGVEKRVAAMIPQALDIQESHLKALHARAMNQKTPPTKSAPAPKEKKHKE